MNEQNQNIKDILRNKWIALLIILIMQIISIFIFYFVSNVFFEERNIKMHILLFGLTICIITFAVFYKMHISRVNFLLNVEPIECIIEDFIRVSYGYIDTIGARKKKDYRLYPVVKVKNELFFTYGDYCISHYNQIYTRMNKTVTDIAIFRKDKSKVEIGDKAYLYIKKKIDVNVEVDTEKNKYKINKQKEYFHNFNKNYDIEIVKKLNFFEGLIDIEYMK